MSNLSPKTIQKHVDNIWVSGGDLITELHYGATPCTTLVTGVVATNYVYDAQGDLAAEYGPADGHRYEVCVHGRAGVKKGPS